MEADFVTQILIKLSAKTDFIFLQQRYHSRRLMRDTEDSSRFNNYQKNYQTLITDNFPGTGSRQNITNFTSPNFVTCHFPDRQLYSDCTLQFLDM